MEEGGCRMVRYADDFVILCRTEEEARSALRQVEAWVAANGLTLHPDKTRVGDSRQPGQGFDFLGYRFEAGRRLVRKKSLKALRDKVRGLTSRSRGDSLERIITDLNPMLRGWFGYFQHATPALVRRPRRLRPQTVARHPAQAGKAPRHWTMPSRPSPLAQCLLRGSRPIHPLHGL